MPPAGTLGLRPLVRSSRAAAWAAALAALLWANGADAAVEILARCSRQSLTVGEATSLEVTVRGAPAGTRSPDFVLPDGLELLGSARSRSTATVGGKGVAQTVYRFELAANRAGRFRIGPIQARVGNQVYEAPAVTLTVSTARARVASAGGGAASLVVDVAPGEPYVGQAVIMRVRLIQRAALAEDPRYEPPQTTGFWAERPSEPTSYYADQERSRVLVTETRTRLYPLAGGEAAVGEASATLALATAWTAIDPLRWLGGRPPRREVVVRSGAVRVRVRNLPAGAPDGFTGAVGRFAASWYADRARTTEDVPVTVRLEIRGLGNLPLLRAPVLASRAFEVYANTVDDSLAEPGAASSGRRRFQWTVLPRRQGRLDLPAPEFAWFDPEAGAYRSSSLEPVALDVGPPLGPGGARSEDFPVVFGTHPVAPFRRPARPWAFAVAGLAAAAAVRLWRRGGRPDEHAAERARQREWMHAMRHGSGPDFWTAADRACVWLAERGQPARALRLEIEASRYGGRRADPEAVRRRLLERLTAAVPAPPPRWLPRVGAVPLAVAALFTCVVFAPQAGDRAAIARAAAADRAVREGDLDRARAEWGALWSRGAREPGLAARLAWIEMESGAVGQASLWILRGDRGEPRDPALSWVIGQVRDTGGLIGFAPARLPVRSLEWSLLALVVGAVVVTGWPRRAPVAAALVLLVAVASVYPLQGWLAERPSRGVVKSGTTLQGPNVQLEPGQVVAVLGRADDRARARAGRGTTGWVPLEALDLLEPGP